MVRPIVTNLFLLGRKAAPATREDLPAVQDLMDTLRANADHCAGMAANMIGVNKRFIAVNLGGLPVPMLNPVIVRRSGAPYEAEEACLSLTGLRKAVRYPSIDVEFQDLSFQTRRNTYTGFLAQVIQHEVDHCEGTVI